jgi:hypothetical protein
MPTWQLHHVIMKGNTVIPPFGLKRATATPPLQHCGGGGSGEGEVLLKNRTRTHIVLRLRLHQNDAAPALHHWPLPAYLSTVHILKCVSYYRLNFYSTVLLSNESFSVQVDNKVFLSLIYIFPVCFETDLFFRFRNTETNRKKLFLVSRGQTEKSTETDWVSVCTEFFLYLFRGHPSGHTAVPGHRTNNFHIDRTNILKSVALKRTTRKF